MTSKEALERLLKIAYVEPGPTKEKFITYAREIEHNKTCSDLYNAIKQDLERLEQLEKVIEILKKKKPNLFTYFRNKKIYTESFVNRDLTQEEYELLKEVLRND